MLTMLAKLLEREIKNILHLVFPVCNFISRFARDLCQKFQEVPKTLPIFAIFQFNSIQFNPIAIITKP